MLEMTLVGRRFANGGSNPSVRRKGCNGRTSGGLERVTYKRYAALGRLQFKTAQGEVSSLPDVSSHLSNRWVPGDDDPKQDRRDEHGDDHCNQNVEAEQHAGSTLALVGTAPDFVSIAVAQDHLQIGTSADGN